MANHKNVFKPWFAWNPAKIETYLENMAAEGWQIDQVAFSQMWFRFIKTAPETVRFCTDFQWEAQDDYFQILADDGWELVNNSSGWMLWRKAYTGERPDLYTERQSLIARNRKLIVFIGLVLLLQVGVFSDNVFENLSRRYLGGWSPVGDVLVGIYFALVMFLLYGLIRLVLVNLSLQEER